MSINKAETAVINAAFVQERIKSLDLKIWWISEQISVDRKTISRWLNGSVKWARITNLEALAPFLECQVEDLILQSETDRPVSVEEQKAATLLMEQENISKLLKPTYNWKLLESILRASLQPKLPKRQLAFVYLELARANMHQFHLEEAKAYARKAMEISKEIDHEDFYWRARNVEALCDIYHGNVAKSFISFEECLTTCKDPPTLWLARHMFAEGLWRSGDFERGCRLMEGLEDEQRDLMGKNVDLLNLSKNDSVYGLLLLDRRAFTDARRILNRSLAHAESSRFIKMIHYAKLLLALLDAVESQNVEAGPSFESQHEALKEIQDDHLYYYMGAEIYFELADYDKAEKLISAAIEMGKVYVVEVAIFHETAAKIHAAQKKMAKARKHRELARKLYEDSHCQSRLTRLPIY